jgi:uncharacterized protein YvpB
MGLKYKYLIACLFIIIMAGCASEQAAARVQARPPRVTSITLTPPYTLPTSEAREVFEPSVTAGFEQTYLPGMTLAPPTQTSTAAPSATVTLTPTPGYPQEYYIRGIVGHKQYFKLGCEASVAKDWAWYFGVDINEFEFQHRMPLSDNPDKGFVGDVDSPWGQVPPYGYGVHAPPVAALLREYGLPAKAVRGFSLEDMREEISQGKPVIAWVIGNVVGGIPYEYTDSVGDKVIVAAYEHVVIVTGYNKDSIRYNTNGKFFEIKDEYFLNSFKVLGNMALVYDGEFTVP